MAGVFRLFDVYDVTGKGLIPVGEVMDGVIVVGMRAYLEGRTITVTGIEMKHQLVNEARKGDKPGIIVQVTGGEVPQEKKGFLSKMFGGSTGKPKDFLLQYRGKMIDFK